MHVERRVGWWRVNRVVKSFSVLSFRVARVRVVSCAAEEKAGPIPVFRVSLEGSPC